MEKGKNIPKLRFPEFDGEWKLRKLGDVSTKIGSGSTPLGGEKSYQCNGIVFIRSQNVNNDTLNLDDVVYISESINNKMEGSQVFANDILLNITGASIGRSCVVPSDFKIGNVNQHVSIIRLLKDYNPYFLQPMLGSAIGQKMIFKSQAGGGREGLNFQNIRSFKIYFPVLPEQEKIASFFTAIDQKISLLKRKKTSLELYKKGVIQKIFSQQIRFNDDNGQEFPKWEKIAIGLILKERKEYAPKNNLYEHVSLTKEGVVPKSERYERDFLVTAESKNYKITKVNDICYNPANLKFGVICRNKYKEGIFSPIYITYEVLHQNIEFIEYLVTRDEFIQKARKYEEGTVYERMAVNPNDLRKVEIKIPSILEQTKIANFLSAIDDKIIHTQKQIEKAEVWKKGLMQQMFI